MYIYIYIYIYMYLYQLFSFDCLYKLSSAAVRTDQCYIYIDIERETEREVIISDPWHTECSNLSEARWAQYICNHVNNVPCLVITAVTLWQLMYLSLWVARKPQLLITESSLKMVENAFYFTLKALFAFKIFKFLSWLFGHVEKRLD